VDLEGLASGQYNPSVLLVYLAANIHDKNLQELVERAVELAYREI